MKGKHEYLFPQKQKANQAGQRLPQRLFALLLFPC